MFGQLLHSRVAWAAALAVAMLVFPREARAHCDSMDGPVVTAARKALESGSVHGVLMWVRAQDEAQVRAAFQQTLGVRKLGAEAQKLADYWFYETVVRLHREGEGEPYTGLKPAGTNYGKAIPAADQAIAAGSVAALEEMLVNAVRHGLHQRFERVMATRSFAPGDVGAGRAFVAAYVPLMHYAEQVEALAATKANHEGAAKHH